MSRAIIIVGAEPRRVEEHCIQGGVEAVGGHIRMVIGTRTRIRYLTSSFYGGL